jgi:peptidoglycan/xylan/chitin deacetylase (PgdA/CDA1 family)
MNRQLIKKLAYLLSRSLPLKWMHQLSRQNFIFPFYHLATDTPSPCVKHLFPVPSKKQFRKDLDFLLTYFSPVGYNEIMNFIEQGKKPGRPRFFLSFDDGFSECFHVIAPVLKEKGIPAAFFINPAFVGNKQLGHRQKISLLIDKILNSDHPKLLKEAGRLAGKNISGKDEFIRWVKNLTATNSTLIEGIGDVLEIDFEKALNKYQPYMNVSEINQLKSDGFVIGSHSFDHTEFHLLSLEAMKEQITNSFQFLESNLKTEHRAFSFPFNDIGVPHSFFNYLAEEANVELSFGTSGIKRDEAPRHLQRIPLEIPGFKNAEAIIRSEYFYYIGKALIGKNLVKRK